MSDPEDYEFVLPEDGMKTKRLQSEDRAVAAADELPDDAGPIGEDVISGKSQSLSSRDRSLLSQLADELRSEAANKEDLRALREAMFEEPGGSASARLDRLEGDIAELRAYTDALEEFLDENGGGEQLIKEIRADVNELEIAISEIDSTVETLEASVNELNSDLTKIRGQVGKNGLSDRLEAIEAELAELQSWQARMKQTFNDN